MTTEPFEPAAPEPGPIPAGEPVQPPRVPWPGPPVTTSPAMTTGSSPRRVPTPRTIGTAVAALALAVLIGGVGFAAGRATAPVPQHAAFIGPGGAGGPRGPLAGQNGGPISGDQNRIQAGVPGDDDQGFGGRFPGGLGASLRGTVISSSSTSITIKLADGRSVTVAVGPSTVYHRQADASASDVSAGSSVIVDVTGFRSAAGGAGPTAGSITLVP